MVKKIYCFSLLLILLTQSNSLIQGKSHSRHRPRVVSTSKKRVSVSKAKPKKKQNKQVKVPRKKTKKKMKIGRVRGLFLGMSLSVGALGIMLLIGSRQRAKQRRTRQFKKDVLQAVRSNNYHNFNRLIEGNSNKYSTSDYGVPKSNFLDLLQDIMKHGRLKFLKKLPYETKVDLWDIGSHDSLHPKMCLVNVASILGACFRYGRSVVRGKEFCTEFVEFFDKKALVLGQDRHGSTLLFHCFRNNARDYNSKANKEALLFVMDKFDVLIDFKTELDRLYYLNDVYDDNHHHLPQQPTTILHQLATCNDGCLVEPLKEYIEPKHFTVKDYQGKQPLECVKDAKMFDRLLDFNLPSSGYRQGKTILHLLCEQNNLTYNVWQKGINQYTDQFFVKDEHDHLSFLSYDEQQRPIHLFLSDNRSVSDTIMKQYEAEYRNGQRCLQVVGKKGGLYVGARDYLSVLVQEIGKFASPYLTEEEVRVMCSQDQNLQVKSGPIWPIKNWSYNV